MPIGRLLASVVVAATLAASGTVHAAVDKGLAVRAGTYGVGVDFGVGLNRFVTLRGSYQYLDVDEDFEEGGIDYDGTLDLGGLGLFVDVMPFRNAFRLTAGVVDNRNEIALDATPDAPQEIGGTVYDPAEIGTLSGRVEFDDTVGYLGIGVGNVARGRRVGFVFDAGVVLQGSGSVSLSSSTGLIDPDDLEAEVREVEDDISDYDLWPVISFGVAIRF